jgi:hypothetical protein
MKQLRIETFAAHEIEKSRPLDGISVQVSIKLGFFPVEFERIGFVHTTKNGRQVIVHGFSYEDGLVKFYLEGAAGKTFKRVFQGFHPLEQVHTTFPDFLWKCGDGTTPVNKIQCDTPIPDGREGNLPDALPQTFVDDIVHTLYVLNNDMLEGVLENAVLIGPFIQWRQNA